MIRSWSALKLKLVVVVCMAALGALAASAETASAEPVFARINSFGSLGTIVGVTVDNATGDVFAVGKSGLDVEKFDHAGNPVNFTEVGGGTTNILTGAETAAGTFAGPVGLVVSEGHLYVTDEEYANLPESKGVPVAEFDDTTGKLIALPAGSFTPPGAAAPSGFKPFGIAFDRSTSAGDPSKGDVYIADHANNLVYKFKPNGEYANSAFGQTGHPTLAEPDNVAVDAEGNVYVNSRFKSVTKYSPTGTALGVFSTALNEVQALAIDPSSGDIYVKEGGAEGGSYVEQYSSTGTPLAEFGLGNLSSSYAMAVSSTHAVYLSNINTNQVERWEAGETPEPPVTEPATEVTGTTAKLHGTVNPGSSAETGYHFALNAGGLCEAAGSITTTPAPLAIRNNEAVETEATGLSPKTTYKFCLVATNSFGSTQSMNELELTTTAAKPVIESQSSEEITTEAAKVLATINPSGAETTCEVEYGKTSASEGPKAACSAPLPEGLTGSPVSIPLTGLEPNTTYHYRFTATNEKGTVKGPGIEEEAEFTTKPLVTATTESPTEVAPESVKLNGKVKTGTEAAHYYFEYGKEGEGLTSKTPEGEVAAEKEEAVSAHVTGLAAGTPYEYRLVAVATGNVIIPSETIIKFSTPVSKPTVTNKPPSGITRTSATVAAEINTENSSTEYKVEYGTSQSYGESTSLTPLAAQVGASTVSQPLAGLSAGTVYHYRFVATNGTGTTNGPDGTFETEAPKLPIIESEGSAQVTQTTATITATVNPNGLQTSYILEVGTEVEGQILYTPSFGEVGSEAIGVPLIFGLSGLQPGTTYHYRIVAQNEDGTVSGADMTFATPGFPAVIIPPPPVQIIPTPPATTGKPVPVPPVETRAQKYKKAVKLCEKKPKKKRASCLRTAKKRFGPATKKKKK